MTDNTANTHTVDLTARRIPALAVELTPGTLVYTGRTLSAPRHLATLDGALAARGLTLRAVGPHYHAVSLIVQQTRAERCCACDGEVWHQRCRRCGTRAA